MAEKHAFITEITLGTVQIAGMRKAVKKTRGSVEGDTTTVHPWQPPWDVAPTMAKLWWWLPGMLWFISFTLLLGSSRVWYLA